MTPARHSLYLKETQLIRKAARPNPWSGTDLSLPSQGRFKPLVRTQKKMKGVEGSDKGAASKKVFEFITSLPVSLAPASVFSARRRCTQSTFTSPTSLAFYLVLSLPFFVIMFSLFHI